MFLNSHAKNNKRLTLDQKPRQKSYLSSLSKLNKEKSYSTTSLKEQFQQFKSKSLSHSSSLQWLKNQYRPRAYSPMKAGPGERILRQYEHSTPASNNKAQQFKKSYLNLDSKLNKCARPKDYFRSSTALQQAAQRLPPSSYIQASKRLQQERSLRQMALFQQISQLRQENNCHRRQNQELRNQRNVDLQLITRQNQIMQKQEQLIVANQQAQYLKRLSEREVLITNDSNVYTFSNNQNFDTKPNAYALATNSKFALKNRNSNQCQQCVRNKVNKKVEKEFYELKIQKLEEQKRLIKKQIHELVYLCQSYKQALKIAEQKYEKQLQQNQKLIKVIYNQDLSKSKYKAPYMNFEEGISRPYLNLKGQKGCAYGQTQPISIKRQSLNQTTQQKGFTSSPMKKHSPSKIQNYRSASNLIKYIDDGLLSKQENNHTQVRNEKDSNDTQKKQQRSNLQWCQNQNIKKYLQEINREKIREIDQIQNLLNIQ